MALLTTEQVTELRPLILATVVYFLLYYVFCIFQSFAKFYIVLTQKEKRSLREIKYESTRGLALLSDRTFLNMLEQAPPCLAAFWLYGLLIDPKRAAHLFYWYIATRAIYPIAYKRGPPSIFLSTFPNYILIGYAFVNVAMAVL